MKILILTQHTPTEGQMSDGVYDLSPANRLRLKAMLTINELPSRDQLHQRVEEITDLVCGLEDQPDAVMLGGFMALQGMLEAAFHDYGYQVCFSFSQRRCIETPLPSGEVKLNYVFDYEGMIWNPMLGRPKVWRS